MPADSIENWYGSNVTINAGAGNDTIENWYGSNVTINADAGNDEIGNWGGSWAGSNVTISGGKGNDKISLGSYSTNNVIRYAAGDGKDTVFGFGDNDTLYITEGKYTTQFTNGDFVVKSGKGKIILKDIAGGQVIHLKDANGTVSAVRADINYIYNTSSNTLLSDTSGYDSIYNAGYYVTINAGDGSDSIENSFGKNAKIDAGAGNDSIYNDGSYATINANTGNDTIANWSDIVTIEGGAGNDSIYSWGSAVQINAGAGNDSISNSYGENVTITGGKGSDFISLDSDAKNNVIKYAKGDGNDKIRGFNDDDTLKITSGSCATSVSGDDVIVTVGDGSITLKNATNKNISIADSEGKVTNKTFASSALFEEENNFAELDMIVENDFELSDIQAETTQIISPSKSATPNLILSPAR